MSDDSSKDETNAGQVERSEASVTDESAELFKFLSERGAYYQGLGMSESRARGLARLEYRIKNWPTMWGDELWVIIYGDLQNIQSDLVFSELGIIVEAKPVEKSIVTSAARVLKARVSMKEKSISGLLEAIDRVNTLLGVLVAIEWGNPGVGWWCHLTHTSAGLIVPLNHSAIETAVARLNSLPVTVKRKIKSALYWIREPRQMVMEDYRSDVLRVYAGYWNAFECLVEAVCLLRPQPKLTKSAKQQKIDEFLKVRNGILNVGSIAECYRQFVDPGFAAKASHALHQCFPENAERYINECFKMKPEEDRLYNIRNAINHGDIEAEDVSELIRVEDRHRRLWMIVFGMLGQLIPVPRPLDAEKS